jgi:hypothetical protein
MVTPSVALTSGWFLSLAVIGVVSSLIGIVGTVYFDDVALFGP